MIKPKTKNTMSKSNPTTRHDAPNYAVVGMMIHRYEPMDIAEAFGALSQVKNPLCGFRDADFQPWTRGNLYYVHPGGAEPFRTQSEKYQQCARIMVEDPRKVPEGVPELPEPWLAYVPVDKIKHVGCRHLYGLNTGEGPCQYAIDVRTAFAREHLPEYVQALGYPMEDPDPEPKRIQRTDTQLLDKLAESEIRLENGSQLWQVFTDRDDPKMTLREAIEEWGAEK